MIGTQKAAYRRFRFTAVPPAWGGIAHVDRPAAAFLRSYQLNGGYTPGPLLALCVAIGLAGSLLALARRRRPAARGEHHASTGHSTSQAATNHSTSRPGTGHSVSQAATNHSTSQAATDRSTSQAGTDRGREPALACLLFWVTGVVLLLAADITQFSWRYQLPGLVTLPPAAVAGATALLAWSRARRRPSSRRAAALPGLTSE
jgi:hypothetical protein